MNNFKVCIFDLDGTLINSLADLANCVNEALELHSLPTHHPGNYNYFVGNGVKNLIRAAMGDKAEDEKLFTSVYKAFNLLYNEKCLEFTQPYAGIDEMLYELKNNGIKLCVLSNKTDNFAKRIVNSLFSHGTFDSVWGKKENFPTKPSPDSALTMIKELGYQPSDCLYIGDSDVDLKTARNADLKFCGVEWGFRGKNELLENGAKVIVKKPSEIVKLVCVDE